MKSYTVLAPARFDRGPQIDTGRGTAGSLGRAYWSGQGGPGDLGSQFSSAWASFLATGISAAQVGLGALLLVLAAGLLVSQTSAGRAAGGAARRGARFVPVAGAAVR